jgi:hypothetical protein
VELYLHYPICLHFIRGVKLTTHLRLVSRSNNGWSCTSTPPMRLHGVVPSWGSTGTTLPHMSSWRGTWLSAGTTLHLLFNTRIKELLVPTPRGHASTACSLPMCRSISHTTEFLLHIMGDEALRQRISRHLYKTLKNPFKSEVLCNIS